MSSLNREIDLSASLGGGGVVFETIYFGGGTPSLLLPATVGHVLERLHRNFRISSLAEITIEANPGTVDFQKLRELREVGINRLSAGIQSFHDRELKFLSRIHTSEEAKQCIRMAQKAGFENVSLDLIYALPGQRLRAWEENLAVAVSLSPQHISAYSLIVEEGTPLARMVERGEVRPVGEEAESKMYLFTMEYLAGQGYEHYEVSNYAKPDYHSRHNSLYWNHDSYLGFGSSAHSFWLGDPLPMPTRWWNVASVGGYCEVLSRNQRPIGGKECLEREDLLMEEIFLGLRSGGINVHRLEKEYGIDLFQRCPQKLTRFLREDLLTVGRKMIRLTDKGFLFCDGIALELTT